MIRINKIINKNDLLDLLKDTNVAKIELLSSKNKELKDLKVCRVFIYLKTDIKLLCSLVGNCKKSKEQSIKNKNFLSGICSILQCGFIRSTHVLKLIEIEKNEGLNLSIPKEWIKLIEKYNYV